MLSTANEGVDEIMTWVCYLLLMRVLMKYVMGLLSTADEGVDEIWIAICC